MDLVYQDIITHHQVLYDSRSQAMKIVFLSTYDLDNYGTRSLIGQARAHGHEVHVIQFKKLMQQKIWTMPEEAPPLLYYQDGAYIITDPETNPVTNIEQALLAEKLSLLNPDVIGFSWCGVFDNLFPKLGSIAHRACPKAFQIIAGYGPTRNPEFYLQHRVDAVIRGEAEDALADLLNALSLSMEWQGIANIACLDHGTLRINTVRPLEKDISCYPIPWHGKENTYCIENDSCYESTMSETDLASNIASHEGVYHCLTSRFDTIPPPQHHCNSSYLLYNEINKNNTLVHLRTLDHIFAELHEIKQLDAQFIYFTDTHFVRPDKELHEFLDRYCAEINLPFHAHFQPQQMLKDTSIIEKAIHAGCLSFSFEIYPDSEPLSTTSHKGRLLGSQYQELFHKIHSLGGSITVHMVGANASETSHNIKENLNFIAHFPYDASNKSNSSLVIYNLKRLPGADFTKIDPGMHTAPNTLPKFICDSLLIDIKRMASQSQFLQILHDKPLVYSPELLTRLRTYFQNDAYNNYIFEKVQKLRYKKVYFWGCGEIYTMRKHLFADSLPQAILVDTPYEGPSCVTDIPVVHPDTVLPNTPLPIIIFSKAGVEICRRIKDKYPQYPDDNIIICKL